MKGGTKMKGQLKRERKRSLILVMSLLAVFLVSVGLGSYSFAQKVEEVKIGIIEPLSGPMALIGDNELKAFQFAIKRINEAGGIKSLGGAKLMPLIGDSEGKPEVGMTQAERLINGGAVILSGSNQSAVVFSATQVAEKFKTPFIVSTGVADPITERGFKYTFRVMGTASMLSKQFFTFLREIGRITGKPVKTIGLMYEDTLFGQSMSKTHKNFVGDYGYQVVADIAYPSRTSDVTAQVSKLVSAKPDFIILTSYLSDAILITRTLYEMNAAPMGFLGTGGYDQPDYIRETGKLSENFLSNAIWSHTVKIPGVAEINAEFKKLYGFDITGFGGVCYTTAYVMKDVLERAASLDKEKIRKAIVETDMKTKEKGNILHYGVKFDEKGQNIHACELLNQIQGSQFLPVWPSESALAKPIWPFPGWKK
jgi:branched-chain amino acid transport system substrate-binding protein